MIRVIDVLAFQDNNITENDSSIDRWILESEQSVDEALSKDPGSVRTRSIGKFSLRDTDLANGAKTYLLQTAGKSIGVLVLYKNSENVWATDSIGIVPEYQGQSLGNLLYETALDDLGKLGSSTSLSGGSSKLWKALVLKHRGVFVVPEEWSPTQRTVEIRIKDWVVEGKITYPVFSTNRGTIQSLKSLLRSTNHREQEAAKNGYYLIKAFGSNSKISEHWPF